MHTDDVAPQTRFDSRDSSSGPEIDAQSLTLAAQDSAGTLLVDIATTVDGPVLAVNGEHGSITLEVTGGRLNGWITHKDQTRQLDAEDTVGIDDGRTHSIALTVDATGTHVFADGYEAFSSTTKVWFQELGLNALAVDPQGMMSPSRLAIWDAPLPANALVAQSVAQRPLIEFAAAELSSRDAGRLSLLAEGAIRARCRTRGEGQGGVILQAGGTSGKLTLAVENGDITYSVIAGGQQLAGIRAPGRWDDGNWHDIILVSGRGALDLYVDGYQVLHVAGTAFFQDIGQIERVVAGADLDGTRLFGEAQTAAIYDAVLSDHQVKRLASAEPVETRALFDTGLAGSRSYRIPALLTLESGVIIAGADQRVSIPNDSPNDINFVIRRSLDGGESWEPVRTILHYPGSGRSGASVIDSVIVQDRDSGRVIVLIDQFPGGYGQPNAQVGTGYDDQGRMILTDRDGAIYLREKDGSVVTDEGKQSAYHVADDGAVTRNGKPAGNIHLAASDDANESLLSARTAYFQMVWSDDDGETWSDPRDITPQVKEPWMRFFGTSPGNGIQLARGEHQGRLLMPVYYNHEEGRTFSCAAVYSDDGGTTWRRGASPNDGRLLDGEDLSSRDLADDRGSLHESTIVEGTDGAVHAYMRNQHPAGLVAHSVSKDGGESWGEVSFVPQIPEIFSQPNAIRVSLEDGREATVFANASQMLPFRGRGVLRMSFDDGRTWPHNRVLNPRHHVYQSMAQLPDGRLAVLWEREWQGLFLSIIPLSWLLESRSTETAASASD
ncbi:sialidase family protein [Kocuria sp. TGY1127_2]|uniref:sialidase family protein n=1 Tax=Kocuria sp. TGY1127_2 TaxID=2711328 RepID=UPI0015BC383C|nr:sialidase family protein [Kocuria sp. TGY1127_2]